MSAARDGREFLKSCVSHYLKILAGFFPSCRISFSNVQENRCLLVPGTTDDFISGCRIKHFQEAWTLNKTRVPPLDPNMQGMGKMQSFAQRGLHSGRKQVHGGAFVRYGGNE